MPDGGFAEDLNRRPDKRSAIRQIMPDGVASDVSGLRSYYPFLILRSYVCCN
ncbi:hypothetical protein HMPREF0208_03575 [Citrobacter koseri]|uniref:Uncharacterized protein n=1 Tax=Citrobacter koseri (strain ATCC BAA-895 / CDC 4225-83 / SGSC4696) TaxID=290338 RepID=A8AP28_CITK8|nr:hypothetical protein CKO_04177 [Citrobacter koseri ATCC BAA-895]KWZ96420.1 hypothetical protein HMPREF3207_04960 [Citrobacter koseri]KWZ98197.1 hypothetical protein HMPREF3220_02754 [Citrobacter koseri]KXB41587.1 hypothetical protein HMPREF0208_03575 [Citrobacter koseri]